MKPTTTLPDLVETLAETLAVDVAAVGWLARKLQAVDLLPDAADAEVTPLHAARLLVALLAAGRPIDAAAIVAAYERAPALHVIHSDGRRQIGRIPVEDLGIPAGAGSAVVALSRNFISAVTWFIEFAAVDPTTPLPAQISARRSIELPLGVLLDIPPRPAELKKTLTLVYGHRDETGILMGGKVLEVYAAAPGAALQAAADLLCPVDGARPARGPGEPLPPPWSAQLRSPTRLHRQRTH